MKDSAIVLHHAESTLHLWLTDVFKSNLWKNKYTEIGPVLDVKVICHQNVHGNEIHIPSTSGDNTTVCVVTSRCSNRYVDELRYREPENLSEEVAHECTQDQEQEQSTISKVKGQVTAFLFVKEFFENLAANEYSCRYKWETRQLTGSDSSGCPTSPLPTPGQPGPAISLQFLVLTSGPPARGCLIFLLTLAGGCSCTFLGFFLF